MERNWTIELEGITHRIGLTSSIYYPQGTEIRHIIEESSLFVFDAEGNIEELESQEFVPTEMGRG